MEVRRKICCSALIQLLLVSFARSQVGTHFSSSKPSFLFILIDDVGWADLGYNNGTAHTPNIDTWAKRPGTMLMQDLHSGGTVCSPTRATVLTGRNHFRDCVDYVYGCSDMTSCVPDFEFAPSRTFTVGDAVRVAGPDYDDGAIFLGKWHLGSFFNDSEAYGGKTSSPITHGFHHFNATVEVTQTSTANCMCRPEWEHLCNFGHYGRMVHCEASNTKQIADCCQNYWWDDASSPHGVTNLTWPSPDDDASYITDAFERFLHQRRKATVAIRGGHPAPFAAQISFHNCHIPFVGTNSSKEACKRGETCRPPLEGDLPYTELELDYYACLTELDDAIGRVLSNLQQEGYYENTMIFLASDNGPERNCYPTGFCARADRPNRPTEGPGSAGPLRGRKRDIYEGGHRVPGIVSWPAIVGDQASISWETVLTDDFLPTIMDALGVERPPEQQSWVMDGRSILPILRGEKWKDTAGGDRSFGIGYYDAELSVINGWGYREGKWKYVEGSISCTEDSCKGASLFNLESDLGERNDLSDKHPDILAKLQEKFMAWHDSIMASRQNESKCTNPSQLSLPVSVKEKFGNSRTWIKRPK